MALVTKTINGADKAPSYLHKSMLTPKQSIDGKWASITSDNQNVAADVVAMDSPLPLKSRPSLQTASGDIPKMGMELKMNENQLDQLDTLIAKQADVSEIVTELFDDAKRTLVGIEEQKEYLFLRGLSSGVALTDTENVGTGVRVDYGYITDNKAGVPVVWTNAAAATPISDMEEMISKADAKGKTISDIMLDKVTFNVARKTAEAATRYATSIGNFGTTKPTPAYLSFKELLEAELGVNIIIVDRSVKFEKDGVKKTVKAWDEGKVIYLTDTNVGYLVWKKVVEDSHRSKSIEYRTGEFGTLVSKYVTHKPFGEWTDVQARQLPVITNVDQIFQTDSKIVQA
ncbi:major capsid protein [Pedobacter nyackensis]|nr:major capsid protein [Pedobacter nyackensis]